MDYAHTSDLKPWQITFTMFKKYNYKYIIVFPTTIHVHDKNKGFKRLLEQAGDTDMVLSRSELDHATVNLDVVIFRRSDWSYYKLHQLYYTSSEPLGNVPLDIILDQVYVKYQHKTLKEFKELLDIGIPYMLTNICVFNEHALVSSKSSFLKYSDYQGAPDVPMYPWKSLQPHPQIFQLESTSNDKIVFPSSKSRKIPQVIFQTMESSLALLNVKQCIDQIRQLNPGYAYYYFTAYDCREFISKEFPDLLEYYDLLLPGAYKADLWRYCILYKYGGFYMDCRMLPYLSFDSIVSKQTEFMSCVDVNQNMVYQAILGCAPQSAFMKQAIDLSIENIKKRKNNVGDLGITGPKVMGMAVNLVLKRTINKDLADINDPRMVLLRWDSFKNPKYLELSNTIFACHKYTKLLTDEEVDNELKYWIMLSGKQHYSVLYRENKVYKTELFK
jgi:mannosyltransferase OCH1-like enzyme